MPSLAVRSLKQHAVLWALDEPDRFGNVKVLAATEICCRWEQTQREIIGPDGAPQAVDGTVCVKDAIAEGSIIRLGCLKDTPGTVTTGLMEVVTCDDVPDIKGRVHVHNVTIRKYRRSLPTVAS
jgi:hypothetical protein